MELNDLILVSTDDHICEPPTVFDNYNGKYKDQMPQVKTDSSGIDAWEFNGRRMPNLGLNAVVGRRPEEYGVEPCAFSQLRKGCYDVHARVEDMNANGVLGSLNFPQFVNNGLALKCDDQKLSLAAVKAYNDWHIDEWAGAYPGRFIPTAILPIWDVQACVDEAVAEVRAPGKSVQHAPDFALVIAQDGQELFEGAAAVEDDWQIKVNSQLELGFQKRKLFGQPRSFDFGVEADFAQGHRVGFGEAMAQGV